MKHKVVSLPSHRRRTPHPQLQLLLNVLQTLLVSHLVPGLREAMPPYPQAISGDCDGDGHNEENPQVGRCDGGSWFGIEGERVVHTEE